MRNSAKLLLAAAVAAAALVPLALTASPAATAPQTDSAAVAPASIDGAAAAASESAAADTARPAASVPTPPIVDKPVEWSDTRAALTRAYAARHYGEEIVEMTPRAVVVHWTAGPTMESAYYHFYHAAAADGTLNYASQFIVDRDGTIYRLLPENVMGRHIIGYNWCAIGIENVGGEGGQENLTDAQAAANIALIKYLHAKYPTIGYVFGHYQQDAAHASGLYREQVAGYHSYKVDPGPQFMQRLIDGLAGEGLTMYPA